MLREFFQKDTPGSEDLFKGLAIEDADCFTKHQGKYPVIWITLKDVKHADWQQCFQNFKTVIYKEYARHRYLLKDDVLYPEEKVYYENIMCGVSDITAYENSLAFLSEFLRRFHNCPTVILIDEYDTPVHAGYDKGYYEEVVGFMRNFLSGGLKDNPHLFKGVLTGILRIAKESIFSGLNNPGVYTILSQRFSDRFGFTEHEVTKMLKDYHMSGYNDRISDWYNGYIFGGTVIYNPWSVLCFIDNQGEEKPYWVNTSDTRLIERLATRGGRELKDELGQLLEKGSIQRPVHETIVMRDLDKHSDLIWSFLLFSGYLKPIRKIDDETWELSIPNREVELTYRHLIKSWFSSKIEHNDLESMLHALESGDVPLFERMLQIIVKQVMSFHDLGNEPEKVYHALVLGMLVWMSGKYDIRSNRESGFGRYDVMLKPKDPEGLGIIIEFKKVETKGEDDYKTVIKEALEQIHKKGYAAELESSGVKNILKIAAAFRGKQLWMDSQRNCEKLDTTSI
jgi:hypothetical protein